MKNNAHNKKNVIYLQGEFVEIDERTREELSKITKETGNNILSSYEAYAQAINDQRSENLRLQMEVANLSKEKNSLKHDLRNSVTAIRRLESFMGVKPDLDFDNMFNDSSNK